MTMLDPLTYPEARELTLKLSRAVEATSEEVRLLLRCASHVRDDLYGPGILKSYTDTRDELTLIRREANATWARTRRAACR